MSEAVPLPVSIGLIPCVVALVAITVNGYVPGHAKVELRSIVSVLVVGGVTGLGEKGAVMLPDNERAYGPAYMGVNRLIPNVVAPN